jgi:predicted dehydrogenase
MEPNVLGDVRVGLIGFGYWGPNIARNLREIPGVCLAGIADVHPGRRRIAAAKHPGVMVSDSALGLIAAGDIDAVVVATPVSTHFALAQAALNAGKDVLVEKPLASTSAEAETLGDLADRHGRILMVDHTYVYSGPVRKITELIEAGELGDVCYYDSTRINLGLFQTDVSVIWDLASHDISLLHHVLGRKFQTVQCTGMSAWGSDLESVAHITLGLEGNIQAHVNVSWIAPVKIRQTIIVGDRKMLLYNDLESDEKIKVYDRGLVLGSDGRPALLREYRIGDMYSPRVDRGEPLANVCTHFAECVRKRARPRTGAPEGLAVVQALEAAEWSLRHGGQLVTL